MKPLDQAERDTLEQLIDRHSLTDVLNALEIICNDKADHIIGSYQDRALAKVWRYGARCLDRAASTTGAEGL